MSDAVWLLLHGTPLTPATWDGVRPLLEAVAPVIAPSLPAPSGPVDAQREIADRLLGDLADERRPLRLVGHSFGGQVALEVALRAPERVASLTVLCSRATPFPAFAAPAAALRSGDPVDVDASIGRWFRPGDVDDDGPVVQYARHCLRVADRRVWADELDAIATYDRSRSLGSISAPTAVIAAEHDHVGTPEAMAAMAELIPRATYRVEPGASHMSPFLDPDGLARLLLDAHDRSV